MKKVKLAILSPSDNNFSETFIKDHKEKINAEVYFYYNGTVPTVLEGEGEILRFGFEDRARRRLDIGLGPKTLNDTEKALYRSLKINKIEVVLAEFGTTAARCLDVIKALDLPLIVHFHGFDAHQNDVVKQNSTKYKEAFNYASSIVAVSNHMRDALINLGAPKYKVHVNPCSPNPDFFHINRGEVVENQTFLFVGRFVEKKGPMKLVEAFMEVEKRHKGVKLIMVGDGPLFDKTLNFARISNLDELIFFPGKLKHKEVKSLMASSFCYVQHSITAENGDSEGTPVAIMEAAAAGMPIVSTRHAGIKDVIVEGETGCLVEEGDVSAMANCIIEMLDDPSKAAMMGKASRAYVSKNFTQEKSIEVLDGLVIKAIGDE
ncbi:MAG: colanic acid/amylovoran biosynthesis glycosyltransferase [Patiriisocius sp.]|jgi:colanic acid/amylovoran biosynthesis glycosyltransferase